MLFFKETLKIANDLRKLRCGYLNLSFCDFLVFVKSTLVLVRETTKSKMKRKEKNKT